MQDFNYIVLHGWTVNHLGLNSNEWILYSYIYGFSQDGINECRTSLEKMAKSLGIGRTTVVRTLDNLVDKGLIIKRTIKTGKHNKETYYRVNMAKIPLIVNDIKQYQNGTASSTEMAPQSSTKMAPYNNNIIINKFNNARSAKKSKNKFNNFSQNNYDFKKIEDFLDEN